jgi:hypothetical protein
VVWLPAVRGPDSEWWVCGWAIGNRYPRSIEGCDENRPSRGQSLFDVSKEIGVVLLERMSGIHQSTLKLFHVPEGCCDRAEVLLR